MTAHAIAATVIGASGGIVGGLLGIGGSVVMIPALTVVIGPDQQQYQAAAMLVNAVVGLAAAVRHARSGAVQFVSVGQVLPGAIGGILLGVAFGNRLDAVVLQRCFGAFLLALAVWEVIALVRAKQARKQAPKQADGASDRPGMPPSPAWTKVAAGMVMGVPAGLLGIGGGLILVPMLERLARLPLRQAIGTSAAVIVASSTIGAVAKLLNLGAAANAALPVDGTRALWLAFLLIPGGVVGALVGASLTHRLPTRVVKLALVLLLVIAGVRMSGIVPGGGGE